MIANVTRGRSVFGLVSYLVGEGRFNEHSRPTVVAGAGELAAMYDIDAELGWSRLDVWSLSSQLDRHRRELAALDAADDRRDVKTGRKGQRPRHVYHVSMSLRADEGLLGDDKWAAVAGDYVRGMGFADCEWVAIHHGQSTAGNDHVHVLVNLVRADGTWASTREDFRRSMRVSRELEAKYGLRPLRDSDRDRGLPGFTPGEQHTRTRTVTATGAKTTYTRSEPQRVTLERLVRIAASCAGDERDFVRSLWRLGVVTRVRYGDGGTSTVTGYAVALKDVPEDATQIWQSGSKLAPDLSLPALRRRWTPTDEPHRSVWGVDAHQVPTEPWTGSTGRGWEAAVTEQLRRTQHDWRRGGDDDRGRWRDHTSDTAGLLGAAAYGLGDDRLAAAARQLAAQAQPRYGDRGRRSPDVAVAQAVRLLCTAGDRNDLAGWLAVLKQLQRLAEATADASHARGELIRATRIRDSMTTYVQALTEDLALAGVVGGTDQGAAAEAARTASLFGGPVRRPSPARPTPRPDRAHGRDDRRDHRRER